MQRQVFYSKILLFDNGNLQLPTPEQGVEKFWSKYYETEVETLETDVKGKKEKKKKEERRSY